MTNQKKEKKHTGFEMDGCYEHMGGSKMHMIAVVEKSLMWMSDVGYPCLIGEGRDGSLQPCSSNPRNGVGWYQITEEIFIEDHKAETFKISHPILDAAGVTIGYDYNYIVKIYPGKTLLFSLEKTDKFLVPLVEDDPAEIIDYLQSHGIINNDQIRELEKLFFEKL